MTAPSSPTPPPSRSRQPSGPVPASRGSLLGAWLVDLAVVALPALLCWYLGDSVVLGAIVAAEVAAVLLVLRAATGRTPGAWVARVVSVAEGSDHAPGLRRELVRAAVWAPLHLTLVGPAVTIALGREGRDWTDRLAGTVSLDLRAPTQAPTLARDDYGRPVLPTSTGPGWEVSPSAGEAPTPPPPGPALLPHPVDDHDHGGRPPTPAAAPAPVATPVPAQSAPTPVAAPSTPTPSRARVWLVLDSGQREEVDTVLVLGRAPSATGQGERPVAVPDPTRSLSRTHLRVGPEGEGVWVEDAFSANGTSARTAAGEEITLDRGVRHHLEAGTVLTLGERSITVAREGASRH